MASDDATETVIARGPDEVAARAAARVAELLVAAVQARGEATLWLSGGTTPRLLYRALVPLDVPWPAVRFGFGDERAVPPDHPDANFRLAREALFEPLAIDARRVLRIRGEAEDLEAEAARAARDVPDAIDVLLLGLGEDGHTASLFPGAAALAEAARRVVPVIGPKPPPRRLTITPPVIAAARSVLVLATGTGKAEALRRALRGTRDVAACPAQLARGRTFFVDEAAARDLGAP